MNIIHMKYAVEVAKVGSINKASENLNMAQPNISRAIKDLESDLGIVIFDRSAKGMNLTPEGKEFIAHAQKILNQLNDLEHMFKEGNLSKQKFSLSAPRAGYIADIFAKFTHNIDKEPAEIELHETDAYSTIKKVLSSECKLGIIRYEEDADKYFKEMLEDNSLYYRNINTFKRVILVNKNSLLAKKEAVYESDLKEMIQITHANPYAATLSASDAHKVDLHENSDRCIYVLDSAAQLELLSENADTFMWVSPVPKKLLDRYGLVEINCADNEIFYKDVLIHRNDFKSSELDNIFISMLIESNVSKNEAD